MSCRVLARTLLPLTVVVVALLAAGCGSETAPATAETTKFRPAGEGDAAGAPPDAVQPSTEVPGAETPPAGLAGKGPLAPETSSTKAGSPIAVPEGDVAALSAFIDRLGTTKPKGTDPAEELADFVRMQDARLAAVKKILEQKPGEATKMAALNVTFEIFNNLGQLRVPGTRERMNAFAKDLAAHADPELARRGRFMQLNLDVNELAAKSQDDGTAIVARVKRFADEEKETLNAETLALIGRIAEVLVGMGLQKEGLETLAIAAETAAGSSDEKLAAQQHLFRDRALMIELDPDGLHESVASGEPDAAAKLSEKLKATLAKATPSQEVVGRVHRLALMLELTGYGPAALDVLDQLKGLFERGTFTTDEEKEFAAKVLASIDNAHRRAALVGQTISIEGVSPDGKPFDWSAYQGKVVLVDFWATWCDPCIREMSNIRANYDEFRELGFDVVGVSLDTQVGDLTGFIKLNDVPWAIVTSTSVVDGTADKQDHSKLPMAEKFGVEAIPFTVLVGKDGKVDSLHVIGPKLRSRLVALLGEPEVKPAADPPATQPPATEKPADAKPAAAEKPAEVKDATEKSVLATPLSLLLAAAALTADEPAAAPPATTDDPAINPYAAKPGLSTEQLTSYVLKMLDKPKTIQARPGFCAAVCEACDRVMSADPPATEIQFFVAAESKFETLHKQACTGDADADKQLAAFVEKMKDDQRPRIARPVAFLQQERKVLAAVDGPAEKIPDLLKELQEYYAKEKLTAKHLRMASSTVALINKLESGDQREKHFGEFGGAFAKSSDKELARYGKKLAKKPAATESDLVGQPLELAGATAKGAAFAWESYRGKVVLVDFWATWCGPCRREMPHVKALYEKLKDRGFEVVGVSLDEDQEALAAYLEENAIAWETLAGEETQQLAEKYSVRGIPTMMLVDKDGKILGVAHNVAALAPLAEKQLSGSGAAK